MDENYEWCDYYNEFLKTYTTIQLMPLNGSILLPIIHILKSLPYKSVLVHSLTQKIAYVLYIQLFLIWMWV